MPISYRKRYAAQREEIVEYTDLFDKWHSADKFGAVDLLAWGRLLKEWTGDENFGCNPKIKLDTHKTMGRQFFEGAVDTIIDLRGQLKQKDEIIAYYRLKEDKKLQEVAVIDDCNKLLKLGVKAYN